MIDLPQFDVEPIIFVGIFLGVLVTFDGLWRLISRGEVVTEARNRRMRLIAKGATPQQILGLLKPRATTWHLSSIPVLGTLPQDLRQAELTIRPAIFLICGAVAAVMISLALSARLDPILSVLTGVPIGLILPAMIVRKVASRRLKVLVSQLPDALELMARGLKVGHPINATITTISRDMPDPIATEFGIIVDQVSYGDDLVDAFRDFAERVNVEDVRYLATSVAIQSGTGGDLARILLTLAKVIRARIIMRKRILAISSEGRLTAIFMSLLPLFIFGSTTLTSPTYYAGVSGDPLFRPVAISVIGLVVANFLAMRRLVNFRI